MNTPAVSLEQVLMARQSIDGRIIDVDEPVVKQVIFTLGHLWLAFPGDRIREILTDCPVFSLPGCPPTLEGVINVRGDIESVLHLGQVLGVETSPPSAKSRILLVQGHSLRTGVRVDSVEDVIDVVQGSIRQPPHTLPERWRPVVQGIVEFGGHPVTILDVEYLFEHYRSGLL